MFGDIKRLIGNITVVESAENVTIEGLPADIIERDIAKIWQTSRINKNMFVATTRSKIVIPKFFLIEFIYALNTIERDVRSYTSRGAIKRVVQLLETETWIAKQEAKPSILNFDRLKEFNLTPKDHQLAFLRQYDTMVPKMQLNGYILAAAAGSGKAQPLDSVIKVPGGWKYMGDMNVGDEVIAADGSVTKVIGVFPQGDRKVYKLTFKDGRVVRADEDHIWRVFDIDLLRKQNERSSDDPGWRNMTTKELIEKLKLPSKRNRIYIPLCQSEEGVDRILPLDPYVLGALLGDGCLTHGVSLSNPEHEIVSAVDNEIQKFDCRLVPRNKSEDNIDYRISGNVHGINQMLNLLRQLGIHGKSAYSKFIPHDYLLGSHKQRVALLQGLMDTDGYITDHSTMSYSTSSIELADNVAYLVRSLGGIAHIVEKTKYFTYLGIKKRGAPSYQVNIRHKTPSLFFRLPRKHARANDNNQYADRLRLRLVSIEFDGVEPTQCISIEHPSRLYVTDNFIVTHNTASGLMLARCLEVDCMIVVCPKNAVREVWPDNVNRFSKQPKTMWVSDTAEEPRAGLDYYFCHYEALPRLLAVAPKIFKNKRVMIDLDECHNFNDPDSLRSKQFFELCKLTMAEHIVWASGTPFKAMAKEMIGFLKTCDPFFNNKVEERFKAIFGISVGRAADILSHRLGLVSYKVDKKHVMGDTDPIVETINVKIKDGERFTLDNIRTEMVRFINDRLKYYKENRQVYLDIFYKTLEDYENSKLNQAQLEAYKQYLKDVKAIQSTTDYRQVALEMRRANAFEKEVIMPRLSGKALADFRKAKGVVKYVSLVIRGEALGGILGRRRIECHTELVKHIPYGDIIDNAEKKTLIFSSYVEVVDVMQQELSKLGYNPLLVYGDTNKNLDSILRKFDTDPKANPLVATLQSLSTAVPVLSANTVVFTNSPFRVHERTQAISRVHRLGQDTQTYVFDILLDTGGLVNISTRSLDIMQWSADQVDLLLGKVGDVSLEELGVDSIKD